MTPSTDAGISWREDVMSAEAKARREEHQEALAERYRAEQEAQEANVGTVTAVEN